MCLGVRKGRAWVGRKDAKGGGNASGQLWGSEEPPWELAFSPECEVGTRKGHSSWLPWLVSFPRICYGPGQNAMIHPSTHRLPALPSAYLPLRRAAQACSVGGAQIHGSLWSSLAWGKQEMEPNNWKLPHRSDSAQEYA